MSMFNDIDWTKNGNSAECISNSKQVITQEIFREDIGHASVQEVKKKGMGRMLTNQKGNGTSKPIR